MNRNQLSDADKGKILALAEQQRSLAEAALQNTSVLDELNLLSEEEFAPHPVHLALAGAFYETDISYTYDEYLNHISLTKAFAEAHPAYTLYDSATQVFRNIQILISKLPRIS